MSVGGYDVECVDEISKDFYCIICLKLMRNAIQMNCGHGMCRTCFDEMIISYQRRNVASECPSCRSNTSPQQIVQVPMVDRMISAVKVMCQTHKDGCEWIGELSNMQVHNDECIYRTVSCPIPECLEFVQHFKIFEHMRDDCHFCVHDCVFKEFGCNEKVNKNTKHIHEGDANHLMLFQQVLKEKDAQIEKLKKENESLKEKLGCSEDVKVKINDVYALLKCNLDSVEDIAGTSEPLTPKSLSSLTLNDSNIIIDEIKNKYDLVDDLNDEASIRDSIIIHQFFNYHSYKSEIQERYKLTNSLHTAFNRQLPLLETERKKQYEFVNNTSLSKLCNAVSYSQKLSENEWRNRFTNFCFMESSICNFKIHLMKTFYHQLMYIRAKKSAWDDDVSKSVLILGKHCYVRINNQTTASEVAEGVECQLDFQRSSHMKIHVHSIKEVFICDNLNCIRLEPTSLIDETFDDKLKRYKRVFITKRRFNYGLRNNVYEHDVIYLKLLLE